MVAVFLGLKWHLLRGRLRRFSGNAKVGLAVGALAILAVVAFIAWGIISARPYPEAAVTVAVLFMVVQLVSWAVAPLLVFGVDETLDPSRFALLPLRPRTLIGGLLASSVIGWLPIANLLLLVAVAITVSTPLWVLPIALLCVLLQFVLCVVVSRAAATSMSALMNSRRGRDLGMFVGFGIFVVYLLGTASLNSDSVDGVGGALVSSGRVLGWTPPGALARVPGLIGQGRTGEALAALAIGVAAVLLGLLWWSRALTRTLESGHSMTAGSAPGRSSGFGGDHGSVARVVAARDLVLTWRDPMRRMAWLMSLVMLVLYPFIVMRESGALFAVAFGAALVGSQAGNQLAIDGSGLWLHLVVIGRRSQARAEIVGHTLAALLPGMVLVTLATVGVGLVQGQGEWLPAALGINLGAVLGSTALACWLSVAMPYGIPQSRTSMFASAVQDHKGRSLGVVLGCLAGAAGVAAPAVVITLLAANTDPAWGWAALAVGLLVGAGLLLVMVTKAATRYVETGPEIFAMVASGDRF